MAVTIELTEDQMQALSQPQPNPPQMVNPHTHEAFVLLPVDQYKKLTEELYDDSPWTREELHAIARQTAERTGWDGENDEAAETPTELK
jgi:alpha-D-ribose 1-methylphosphonate 5-phosphate C-P lyase